MAQPLYISASDVRSLVSMTDLVSVLEPAFKWFSTGKVVQPVRSTTPVQDRGGCLLSMPGYCSDADSLAIKVLSFFPNNVTDHGLPVLQGTVLLFDPKNGILKALIDGIALTDMRTAAASACAVKTLVSHPPSTVCVVGTGVQARGHIQALTECFPQSRVLLWGRNRERADKCASDVRKCNVEVCDSLEEAVREADVIATVTMPEPNSPVLFGRLCKPGAVICSVGAAMADRRELDDELITNSVVIADTREGALKEAGDVIIPKVEIYAELGEIIAGTKALPKIPECGKKFIVFKSLGMAVEDVVSAKLVYDKFIGRNDKTS